MKNTVLVVCLLAVLLGVVSAAVTTALLLDSSASEEAQAGAVLEAAQVAEMRAQVRALQAANQELRERLATVELRPVADTRDPVEGFATQEELEALREEVREWMARSQTVATKTSELAATPEFEEQVADALQSVRKQEAISYYRKSQERKAAELDKRVTRLTDWLELDGYQSDERRLSMTNP